MDKSSGDTPRKGPVLLNVWVFNPLTPFQCCNHVAVSTKRISTLKRGRGGLSYRQKRCFLNLRKDADKKRLFCSNVSTLLSMIVLHDIHARSVTYMTTPTFSQTRHSLCCDVVQLGREETNYGELKMKEAWLISCLLPKIGKKLHSNGSHLSTFSCATIQESLLSICGLIHHKMFHDINAKQGMYARDKEGMPQHREYHLLLFIDADWVLYYQAALSTLRGYG